MHVWSNNNETEHCYIPSSTSNRRNIEIDSLSLCHDATYICYQLKNGRPEIITLKDKDHIKMIHPIRLFTSDIVKSLTFKRNTKRYIAIGTDTSKLFVYDTKSKSLINPMPNATSAIHLLDFNVNDELLIAGCEDATNIIYDVEKCRIVDNFALNTASKLTALK